MWSEFQHAVYNAVIPVLHTYIGAVKPPEELQDTTSSPTPPPSRQPKDVVIVTDIGIGLKIPPDRWGDVDDAYAIYRILLEQVLNKVNVIAIAVQFGNVQNVGDMYEKLQTLIRMFQLPINNPPVLIRGPSMAYCGQGSVANVDSSQMSQLIEHVKSNPRPVTVIGIGPATAVAYLMDDTEAAAKVDQIYLEMGQYGQWMETCGFSVCGKPVGDFNFKTDIAAVQRLLQLCPNKLYFTPFQVIESLKFDKYDLMQFLHSGVQVERWLAKETRNWYEQWTRIFTCQDYIRIWDIVPILVGSEIAYDSCTFRRVHATVEDCSHPTAIMNQSLVLTDVGSSSTTSVPESKQSMVCAYYRYKPTVLNNHY